MNPAFVPASLQRPTLTKSFVGTAVTPTTSTSNATVSMAAYSLKNYAKFNDDVRPVPPAPPSPSSNWWVAYRDSLKLKISPFRGSVTPEVDTEKSVAAILAMTPLGRIYNMVNASKFAQGGDPDTLINTIPEQKADKYMAECIVKQYKMTAVPNGVYNVQCTEGTVKLQAEEARNAALSAQFRLKQRSSSQKFGDFTETRRKAIIAAHGCSYEEKLLDRFPMVARTYVTAGSEARGNCVRYANGVGPEEIYMSACVDKQMKFRAVPFGVYDVICNDGNAKHVPEYKRVSAMAARFRAQQLPETVKAQARYNNIKYARDFFTHECSYEENLFNKYPAVSASMRPSTARY